MIRALALATGQLGDRRIVRVLLASLLITLLLFGGLGAGVALWLRGLDCFDTGMGSFCPNDPAASIAGSLIVTVVLMWLLFPAVALLVLSLFSDRIVDAVEARYYPAAAANARAAGWLELLRIGLGSAGRVILWNGLALPLYLLLIVTGVGPFLLFLGINALILGRDLSEMVAVRHLGTADRRAWLAATRVPRAALGLVVSLLFMVPLLNLLAPIVGAAMATHLFHGRGRNGTA